MPNVDSDCCICTPSTAFISFSSFALVHNHQQTDKYRFITLISQRQRQQKQQKQHHYFHCNQFLKSMIYESTYNSMNLKPSSSSIVIAKATNTLSSNDNNVDDNRNNPTSSSSGPSKYSLFPRIEPYSIRHLQVTSIHTVYYEISGNPNGIPVCFVHGGPGGGTEPAHRRFFNPEIYKIVLIDQRGCGKSRPFANLEQNTTWDLIHDMECIREDAAIDQWVLFGGSWGSTLSIAYAQEYPHRVLALILRGIFLSRKSELDWLYERQGIAMLFPEAFKRFVNGLPPELRQANSLMHAYHGILSRDEVSEERRIAANAWSQWEYTLSTFPRVEDSLNVPSPISLIDNDNINNNNDNNDNNNVNNTSPNNSNKSHSSKFGNLPHHHHLHHHHHHNHHFHHISSSSSPNTTSPSGITTNRDNTINRNHDNRIDDQQDECAITSTSAGIGMSSLSSSDSQTQQQQQQQQPSSSTTGVISGGDYGDDENLAFARIESHFFVNNCFFDEDGMLLREERMAKIRHIKTCIVQGRWDFVCPRKSAFDLVNMMDPNVVQLHIIENAGHSTFEPGIEQALLAAAAQFGEQLKTQFKSLPGNNLLPWQINSNKTKL